MGCLCVSRALGRLSTVLSEQRQLFWVPGWCPHEWTACCQACPTGPPGQGCSFGVRNSGHGECREGGMCLHWMQSPHLQRRLPSIGLDGPDFLYFPDKLNMWIFFHVKFASVCSGFCHSRHRRSCGQLTGGPSSARKGVSSNPGPYPLSPRCGRPVCLQIPHCPPGGD